MRILVLSDSHGRLSPMEAAVEAVRPQRIFHLGDGWDDARDLHRHYPDIPLHQVRGNCDYRPGEPEEETLVLEGLRLYLCHGHRLGVKTSLLQAGYLAEERGLDCFLFGHTHQPFHDRRGKCTFLNPGRPSLRPALPPGRPHRVKKQSARSAFFRKFSPLPPRRRRGKHRYPG